MLERGHKLEAGRKNTKREYKEREIRKETYGCMVKHGYSDKDQENQFSLIN